MLESIKSKKLQISNFQKSCGFGKRSLLNLKSKQTLGAHSLAAGRRRGNQNHNKKPDWTANAGWGWKHTVGGNGFENGGAWQCRHGFREATKLTSELVTNRDLGRALVQMCFLREREKYDGQGGERTAETPMIMCELSPCSPTFAEQRAGDQLQGGKWQLVQPSGGKRERTRTSSTDVI